MKKYKLIQDYPESPKIGSIVNSAGIFKIDKRGQKVFDGTKRLKDSHLKYLKDKRYWKKIVEKDYEILSFISNDNDNLIWKKAKDGRFDAKYQMYRPTEKDSLNEKNVYIHSVKRLSDGEVFTVGDKIVFLAEKPHMNHTSSIKSFKIEQNTIYIFNPGCLIGSLKNIKHIKKPLFTTEDGVDLYDKSHKVYAINVRNCEMHSQHHGNSIGTWINGWYCKHYQDEKLIKNYINNLFKLFSTKEAAEEYILMNKPCLSINEISSISTVTSTYLKNLKGLVKLKL